MSELKLVVFDVDGTLVDSRAMILTSMQNAYTDLGLTPPSKEAIFSIVGLSLLPALEILSPELDDDTRMQLGEGYKSSYAALRVSGAEKTTMFDGAMEALEALRAREDVLLGIATGKSRRGLTKLLESHDLTSWFLTTQTADEHPSKPHPSMLHQTLRDTGAEAERAVIIGDTAFDVEMGHAAGFLSVGVSWGFHTLERLQSSAPSVLINDFAGLVPALDALWGE